MLRQRPDRKDQVHGINLGDFALCDPAVDDCGLFVDQVLQPAFHDFRQAWGTLQGFVGKQAAFARHLFAHLQLALNVLQQFFARLAGRIDVAKRLQPDIQQVHQKGAVDVFFA